MNIYRPPGWENLCQLPLRAIVAYAVRHARRVQPLLNWLHDSQFQMVEDHLEAVECFCRAEPFSGADFAAADQVVREAAAEATERALFAAKTVTGTFRAVRHAIEASHCPGSAGDGRTAPLGTAAEHQPSLDATEIDEDTADALAAVLAARAARPVEVPWDAEEVAHVVDQTATHAETVAHIASGNGHPYNPANDLERLVALALGEFPSLGKPVDPSEHGPLGKLWLGTSPPWCIRQRKLW